MLVLSRRVGQSIIIGDGIEVKIVEVKGDQVRVGITAPADIAVHRLEVYQQIQAENREAARAPQSAKSLTEILQGRQR